MVTPAEVFEAIRDEAGAVLIGNQDVLEHVLIATLTKGHVLLEGPPGVAKTTIARLFASLTDLEYSRIQLMPDLLPSDVTGTQVYREETGEFTFQKGPVFANVVLADEINRATPKTQSALLEAMQEQMVTVASETTPLPSPFLLIATQNPIETEGTYKLPIAQRDRFQFKLQVGLPEREDERELFDRFNAEPDLTPEDVTPVVSSEVIHDAQQTVSRVYVDEKIREYVLDIVETTRDHSLIEHGVSPRATLAFLNGAKAKAAIRGREYVIPDDVKSLSKPVLAHRLVLEADAEFSGRTPRDVVEELVDEIETPGSRISADPEAEIDGDSDIIFEDSAVSDGGDVDEEREFNDSDDQQQHD
ncbi:MoxR family ATPase [Salinigranum marinum]|uniref:AAA family ATPase n=1 Tax=Salinigranum marinum TaxID=1515595 RepID=UPI002989C50C|nr:MoxR family ATPase [Salinigranum marinum]